MSTPTSRARSMNVARFSASRTAEVATARMDAPWMAATCRKRSRASMPRFMAVGGEPLHVGGGRAQPHHLPLAVEHLDAVLGYPRHDQVDRVRADVHGGQDVRHSLYSGA